MDLSIAVWRSKYLPQVPLPINIQVLFSQRTIWELGIQSQLSLLYIIRTKTITCHYTICKNTPIIVLTLTVPLKFSVAQKPFFTTFYPWYDSCMTVQSNNVLDLQTESQVSCAIMCNLKVCMIVAVYLYYSMCFDLHHCTYLCWCTCITVYLLFDCLVQILSSVVPYIHSSC